MTIIAIAIVVFNAMQAHKTPNNQPIIPPIIPPNAKESISRLINAFTSTLVKNLRLKVKPMLVTTNIFTTKLALQMKHQFENILGSKLNSMLVRTKIFTTNLSLEMKGQLVQFAGDVDPEWWAVL